MADTTEKASNLIISILFVAIFLVVMLLALVLIISAVNTANVNSNGLNITLGSVTNESHLMNGTIGYFDLNKYNLNKVSCVIGTTGVTNLSNGAVILHGNWTQSNCRLVLATNSFNNTNWNVTYSYSYDTTSLTPVSSTFSTIQNNVVGMVVNFFSLAPTIGTIFAVVILIGGIVLLVMYVRKMKDQGTNSERYYG